MLQGFRDSTKVWLTFCTSGRTLPHNALQLVGDEASRKLVRGLYINGGAREILRRQNAQAKGLIICYFAISTMTVLS